MERWRRAPSLAAPAHDRAHSGVPAERALPGAILAALIALAAMRARSLDRSGAAAAVAAGTLATAAGGSWATLLVTYFVAATALTRLGGARKAERTGGVVEKGGRRDWRQVAANGGVFAVAALLTALGHATPAVSALGIGALAAAAADSWGTEIGTLAGGTPRSIATLRPVPPGTSGGMTIPGTLAMLAGAGFTALVAVALGFGRDLATAAFVGGVAGAMVDSVIGAVAQSRRRCPRCDEPTEQRVHRCGTATRAAGGIGWLDNDAVNLACTVSGGLLAALLAG